jgi:hypothetical protein
MEGIPTLFIDTHLIICYIYNKNLCHLEGTYQEGIRQYQRPEGEPDKGPGADLPQENPRAANHHPGISATSHRALPGDQTSNRDHRQPPG